METADFDGMYTGCDYDADTGLTYHWNRWRNEDGSAFISEDPARDGMNWYGYAGQNPMGVCGYNWFVLLHSRGATEFKQ